MPESMAVAYDHLRAFWDADPETWGFWARWYDGMLRGAPLDWELQRAVALIDDSVWKEGPEAVAAKISEIEDQLLAERVPQAEEMLFDPKTAQFETRPITVEASELVETTLRQVGFARDVAAKGNCGLNEYSLSYLYIEHTLTDCRDDPNAIEQNLSIARQDIVAGLADGTYTPDGRLDALTNVLERGALDMRANHPEVARTWAARSEQVLRELDTEQREVIAQGTVEIARTGILKATLAAETELDAAAVGSGKTEVAAPALKRLASRVSRMRVLMRAQEVIARIDGHPAYQLTQIVLTVGALLSAILALF
jgi:hypothetical protein